MNPAKVVVLAVFALGQLLSVANVGKPREPITPGVACIATVINAALAWLVVVA